MGRPSNREQLVERTLGVWLSRGYKGASVSDLVAAAGVPKGSFYNHFPSKEAFAVEHVNRYVRSLGLDRLRHSDSGSIAAIREHFAQLAATRDAAAGMQPSCLLGIFSIGVSDDCPDLQAAVRAGFVDWIDALASALTRARDAGEVSADDDVKDLAAALVDGFQGAIARGRVTGDAQPLELFLSNTIRNLTRTSDLAAS